MHVDIKTLKNCYFLNKNIQCIFNYYYWITKFKHDNIHKIFINKPLTINLWHNTYESIKNVQCTITQLVNTLINTYFYMKKCPKENDIVETLCVSNINNMTFLPNYNKINNNNNVILLFEIRYIESNIKYRIRYFDNYNKCSILHLNIVKNEFISLLTNIFYTNPDVSITVKFNIFYYKDLLNLEVIAIKSRDDVPTLVMLNIIYLYAGRVLSYNRKGINQYSDETCIILVNIKQEKNQIIQKLDKLDINDTVYRIGHDNNKILCYDPCDQFII